MFSVKINQQTWNYRVIKISTVKPENTELLGIQEGKDLVSLVTCTPYGINTHRLIVTGERVDTSTISEQDMEVQVISKQDFFFLIIPVVFLGIVLVRKKKKGGKCE